MLYNDIEPYTDKPTCCGRDHVQSGQVQTISVWRAGVGLVNVRVILRECWCCRRTWYAFADLRAAK